MLNKSDIIDRIFVLIWIIVLLCLYYILAYCEKTNIVEYNSTQTNSNSFNKTEPFSRNKVLPANLEDLETTFVKV